MAHDVASVQDLRQDPGVGGRFLRSARGVVTHAGAVVRTLASRAADAGSSVAFYARQMFGERGVRELRVGALVLAIVVPVVLLAGHTTYAGIGQTIDLIVANALAFVVSFLGWLVTTMVSALIWVAQYNGFLKSAAVTNGWVLTRDIVNMFFVISLLLMSFGIMLNVGKYASMDPGKEIVKLATAAVLVNFSRTICGLLIDASQVVMLTFVYGFKETAGKNFLDAFGLSTLMQQATQQREDADFTHSLAMSMALAALLLWISLGVICIMTIMLAVRVVHLWVLVAVSPIAFMPDTLSKIEGIKKQWWDSFNEALFFGPLMAFFLWLSLISVAGGQATASFETKLNNAEADVASGGIGFTEAFTNDNIQSFVIAICLLVVGSAKAKSMAGSIGKTSGEIGGAMKKTAKYGLKKAGGAALWTARQAGGEKLVEKGLSAATSLPLVSTLAASGLIGLRDARKKREGKQADMINKLKPAEQKNFTGGMAVTEAQKARQKAALMATMDNAKKKMPKSDADIKQHHENRKALLEKYDGDDVKEKLKELDKARPTLIMDPTETDPKKRQEQAMAAKKNANNMNSAKLLELDANEEQMPQWLVANMAASQVNRSLKEGSETQRAHILKMLGMENEDIDGMEDKALVKLIKGKQADAKLGVSSFAMLDDEKKIESLELTGAMSQKEKDSYVGGLNAADLKSDSVLGAVAAAGLGGALADKLLAGGISAESLKGNHELAQQIAQALGDKIKGQPKEIADVLRANMGGSIEQKLAVGASVGQTFGEFDASSGEFADDAARERLADFLDQDKGTKFMEKFGQIDPSAISSNGGYNDVMRMSLEHRSFTPDAVRSMIASDNSAQGLATLEALNGVVGMSTDAIDAEVEKAVIDASSAAPAGSPLGADQLAAVAKQKREEVQEYQKKAAEIINELKGGGDAADYAPMTFKQKTSFVKGVKAEAAAPGRAQAVEAEESAVASETAAQAEKFEQRMERKNMTKEQKAEAQAAVRAEKAAAQEQKAADKLKAQQEKYEKGLEEKYKNGRKRAPRS